MQEIVKMKVNNYQYALLIMHNYKMALCYELTVLLGSIVLNSASEYLILHLLIIEPIQSNYIPLKDKENDSQPPLEE